MKWPKRRARRPILWGALGISVVIALLFVSAYAVFPIGLLIGLQHPQASLFWFSVYPYVSSAPSSSYNITGLFTVTSNNPIGVAVGNPVNLTITVNIPNDPLVQPPFSNLIGLTFTPEQGIPSTGEKAVTQAPFEFSLNPVEGSNGHEWSGSEEITFYSAGSIGGVLGIKINQGVPNAFVVQEVTIPPSIQVQPELATEEFATNQIVVSLDLVVIALIIFELYSDYREQDRTKDPNSSSLIKKVNRGEYD